METPQAQGEQVTPVTTEPPVQEGQGEATATNTSEAQATEELHILRTKVGEQEEVWDLKDPERRAKAVEFIQKGIDYGKKSQDIAAWERGMQERSGIGDMVMQDQDLARAVFAKRMGMSPSLAFVEPTRPPQELLESNPQEFGRLSAIYEYQTQAKKNLEEGIRTMANSFSQNVNNAVFAKGRVNNNLSDNEFNQVVSFMQRLQPSASGYYSDQDFTMAVNALFGAERTRQAKLDTAKQINQTLKQTASGNSVTQRQGVVSPPKQKADKEYVDYVKSQMR